MVELNAWLSRQPRWLQEAARRLHVADELSDRDREALVELCKREAKGTLGPTLEEREALVSGTTSSVSASLQLRSIENVVGINALVSGNKLTFGSKPLSIVYGRNGAGKSGYMRLLKHVCDAGARRELLPHVFETRSESQSCKVSFVDNGERRQVEWSPDDGPIAELKPVAVFDQACERVYINREHETVYEPPQLALLRRLVEVCDLVREALAAEKRSIPSRLPRIPPAYGETATGQWLGELQSSTTPEEVDRHCAWKPEDERRLERLNLRLSGVDPKQRVAAQRGTVRALQALKCLLEDASEGLSEASYRLLEGARKKAATSRQEAVDRASRVSKGAPLKGVGSEYWRRLWTVAREYSEMEAYPGVAFPVVDANAHCPLCQQRLDAEAAERLTSFDGVVRGDLEAVACGAEGDVQRIVEALPILPSAEEVEECLDRAGVGDERLRERVLEYAEALRPRLRAFRDASAEFVSLKRDGTVIRALERSLVEAERQLQAFDRDAQGVDFEELARERAELAMRQWLAQQQPAVVEEVERLRAIASLDDARKLTRTTGLSLQAAKLSEKLVTQAFGDRFRSELERFGADYLRVEMVKSRATKGRVLHELVLKTDSLHKTAAVLSDGEKRIVSLAACFADFLAEDRNVPFVFDDPMSSLDQEHEEKVADRLVELAATRQVIVFTHRLPFMMALSESASANGVTPHVCALERTSWGAGVPSGSPLEAQRPDRALNQLMDERLAAIRKAEAARNLEDVRSRTAELCRDLRITLENIVEKVLLGDVVKRCRRAINTKGKLRLVARVGIEDCNLIDQMMTKYSFPEHSQPEEAPVLAVTADVLERDLQTLIEWLGEFSRRKA